MKPLQKSLLLALLAATAGCDLLNTRDVEGTRGRGARAFDPYSSAASGAISLSLQYYNGCAMLPNGEPVSPGSLTLDGYPTECESLNTGQVGEPTARMQVTPGTIYFLRELTAVNAATGLHTDFNDRHQASFWMRKTSLFKDLDWSGMTIGRDGWRDDGDPKFVRETYYENAAWMLSLNDTLLLEVLDADGNVRASTTYNRTDFLAESSTTGHTRASWQVSGILKPQFPGDPVPHIQVPEDGATYRTIVKVSFAGSTNPFKSFTMPSLTGDGVIRVTWSLLPQKPFLFPITFVPEAERAATCYVLDANGLSTDERVPCGFGLDQRVVMQRPANGRFYAPGEKLEFAVSLRDGEGHGLHARDVMPSYNQYIADEANGIAYFNDQMLATYREASASESGFKVVGPLQSLAVPRTTTLPYFAYPFGEPQYYLPPGINFVAGGGDAQPPTRLAVQLPADAKPGTYAIFLKGHRNFMGERLNRLDPFFFQVGQEQPTTYTARVGNCQVCHNGVNSLTNVHHGLSVDHVEACKVCHTDASIGFLPSDIHRIHMNSRKYAQNKADCTLCHLSRESTLFPSLNSCNGCHVQSHASEYFDLGFQPLKNTPNGYGNCAQACHVTTPPAGHVIPAR